MKTFDKANVIRLEVLMNADGKGDTGDTKVVLRQDGGAEFEGYLSGKSKGYAASFSLFLANFNAGPIKDKTIFIAYDETDVKYGPGGRIAMAAYRQD